METNHIVVAQMQSRIPPLLATDDIIFGSDDF